MAFDMGHLISLGAIVRRLGIDDRAQQGFQLGGS